MLWYNAFNDWKSGSANVEQGVPDQWALQVAALGWAMLSSAGVFGDDDGFRTGPHGLVCSLDIGDMSDETLHQLSHLESFAMISHRPKRQQYDIPSLLTKVEWGLGWMAHFMLLSDPELAGPYFDPNYRIGDFTLTRLISVLFVSISNLLLCVCRHPDFLEMRHIVRTVCLFYDVASYGGTENPFNCCEPNQQLVAIEHRQLLLTLVRKLVERCQRHPDEADSLYPSAISIMSRLRLQMDRGDLDAALELVLATSFVNAAFLSNVLRSTVTFWLVMSERVEPSKHSTMTCKRIRFSTQRPIQARLLDEGILMLRPRVPSQTNHQTKQKVL
jgi:hypothetical protein